MSHNNCFIYGDYDDDDNLQYLIVIHDIIEIQMLINFFFTINIVYVDDFFLSGLSIVKHVGVFCFGFVSGWCLMFFVFIQRFT